MAHADISAERKTYLPWSWTVTDALITPPKCPSVGATLRVFAATSGLVSLSSLIAGNRLVAQKITCGLFGKKGSTSYWYLWIAGFGLQLGGNALIAYLIHQTSGYGQDFAVWQLMLFYTARPRLSWAVLQFLARFRTTKNRRANDRTGEEFVDPVTGNSWKRAQISWFRNDFTDEESRRRYAAQEQAKDRLWGTAAKSALLAEGALCLVASYTFGTTIHFGSINAFYHNNEIRGSLAIPARLMYAGALLSLISFICWVLASFPMWLWYKNEYRSADSAGVVAVWLGVSSLFSTWMGSWLFWGGYLTVAGDLYCPPNLWTQAIVWVTMSVLRILVGNGV